jgi:cytochrome bd-type quinol oxidase subunit 1
LAVIAIFAVFGWRARQIERWPFIVGMWLYAADSVIYLVFQEFVAFGFHIFWLVFLWMGLIWVKPIHDTRRRPASRGGQDGESEPAKLPEFLRVEKPAPARAPSASSTT